MIIVAQSHSPCKVFFYCPDSTTQGRNVNKVKSDPSWRCLGRHNTRYRTPRYLPRACGETTPPPARSGLPPLCATPVAASRAARPSHPLRLAPSGTPPQGGLAPEGVGSGDTSHLSRVSFPRMKGAVYDCIRKVASPSNHILELFIERCCFPPSGGDRFRSLDIDYK